MKLWLLTRKPDDRIGYDEHGGMVIRAETQAAARQLAFERSNYWAIDCSPLNSDRIDCVELLPDGPAGIVIEDFSAG